MWQKIHIAENGIDEKCKGISKYEPDYQNGSGWVRDISKEKYLLYLFTNLMIPSKATRFCFE